MAGTLTWLGHAAFRIDTPGGKRVYVDPFLNGNPKCPEDEPERVDLIAITHGHEDHVGDTVALYERFKCRVVAQVELRDHARGRRLGGHGAVQGRHPPRSTISGSRSGTRIIRARTAASTRASPVVS